MISQDEVAIWIGRVVLFGFAGCGAVYCILAAGAMLHDFWRWSERWWSTH